MKIALPDFNAYTSIF